MNNFQNGVSSSDLSPQAFKNSSQNVDFQQTYNAPSSQSSSNAQLLSSSVSGILTVDSGSRVQVLRVETSGFAPPRSIPQNNRSNNYTPAVLIILVVSAGLAVYFLNKYKKSPVKIQEQHSDNED